MSLNSKRKGAEGERELAEKLRGLGFSQARRGQQFRGGQDSPDVADAIPGVHIECKRVEQLRLWDAIAQAESDAGDSIPVLMHRRNRSPWLVTVCLEDLIPFCERVLGGRD